jgi:hypothetical protein
MSSPIIFEVKNEQIEFTVDNLGIGDTTLNRTIIVHRIPGWPDEL